MDVVRSDIMSQRLFCTYTHAPIFFYTRTNALTYLRMYA